MANPRAVRFILKGSVLIRRVARDKNYPPSSVLVIDFDTTA